MALLAALLGRRSVTVKRSRKSDYRPEPRREVDFRKLAKLPCPNERCVTNHESYLAPKFIFAKHDPQLLACAYCEHEIPSPVAHGEAE